jgi:hypothetical protein
MFKRNSKWFSSYNNRPNDWTCSTCNQNIYGSKDRCMKCNTDRYGNRIEEKVHVSGDWICTICEFRVFWKTEYCDNCKVDRYGIKQDKTLE